jgi:hypothetical protein
MIGEGGPNPRDQELNSILQAMIDLELEARLGETDITRAQREVLAQRITEAQLTDAERETLEEAMWRQTEIYMVGESTPDEAYRRRQALYAEPSVPDPETQVILETAWERTERRRIEAEQTQRNEDKEE